MPTGQVKGARKASQWRDLIARADPAFMASLRGIYGDQAGVLDEKRRIFLRAVGAFANAFGQAASAILVRSTGRVNLMGMHIDHRGGYVNPVAVGELVFVAQGRDDDRFVLRNVQADRFGDREFSIREELPPGRIDDWDRWTQDLVARRKAAGTAGDWSNYVKAAALYLQHLRTRADGAFDPPLRGMNVMALGTVPLAAGLSSSSSLVVATMEAVRRINALPISDAEMADGCAPAEWYVGTRGGGGDHAAIKFGRLDHLTHIGSFPLTVDWIPFPPAYRIVLANSLVKAEKSVGARDVFNQRVASYVFALSLARRNFPQYAPKLEHLRDLQPARLGVDEAEIYRVIRSLPQRATRQDVLDMLPHERERIEHVFGSHTEPAEGYRVRQVCMYGVGEAIRSAMAADMLRAGDVAGFGLLIDISHDGDRVTRLDAGRRAPCDNGYPDAKIDALIADVTSGDPARVERARLWRQPGGYDVSTPELDELVDIARAAPGVVGSGLVGAGLGGSVATVVAREHAEALVARFAAQYYKPRGLEPSASIIRPLGGAGVIEV